MQDIIYIKDLRVQAIIGIFGWEREVRQEVSIDLEMAFDCKRAAKTDAIEDTIDYKKITKGIIKFVEESEFQLQETLAESIAELVKNKYKVNSLNRISLYFYNTKDEIDFFYEKLNKVIKILS